MARSNSGRPEAAGHFVNLLIEQDFFLDSVLVTTFYTYPEPAPYCPADWCDVLDGVGMTPEAFKRSRAPDGAKVLACALRRNRY